MKNKLDGREYAVKKVPLKETDPDLCLKVQRKDGNPNYLDMPFFSYMYNHVLYTTCNQRVFC